MATTPFYPVTLNDESFIRGPARLLYAVQTQAWPQKVGDVVNLSLYTPQAGWTDLGATRTGVQISINNTEESFDVDQVIGDFETLPTGWEVNITTALAEMTVDRLAWAWEAGTITNVNTGSTGTEKQVSFGAPQYYTRRRFAVAYQRSNGKARVIVLRKVQRAAAESSISFAKTGEQQTIPIRFRCLPDLSVADPLARFGTIFDQV